MSYTKNMVSNKSNSNWINYDRQLSKFRKRLIKELGLNPKDTKSVASLIAADLAVTDPNIIEEFKAQSLVSLQHRYDELIAFQKWSDIVFSTESNPAIIRAQIITQNYICLVYLKDACFEVLADQLAETSITSTCSSYLTQGKIRDFRNAFSHANWHYKSDFSGLICWVREDARHKNSPMRKFEVTQQDLNFWQTLSRTVANVTYTTFLEM